MSSKATEEEDDNLSMESESDTGNDDNQPQAHITKAGRVTRPPVHLSLYAWSAELDALGQEEKIHEDSIHVFKATSDPDTLYYHEAMRDPNAQQFKDAMVKEVKAHTEKQHWEIIRRDQVPEEEIILPMLWAMK